MKFAIPKILAAVLLIVMTSCATSYKPVTPSLLPYRNQKLISDSLKISFTHDVQFQTNNKRYAKRERTKGMSAIAIKIENNFSKPILITKENFSIFVGEKQLEVLSPEAYAKKVKQKAGFHLLHALWGPWAFSYQTDSSTGETDFDFIYLPIGAIVGLGNTIKASNANIAHLETMKANEIWGKEIKPRQTLYGIILVQPTLGYEDLNFILK